MTHDQLKKKNKHAAALGKLGGRQRMARLSAEERSELARKGAVAKWAIARAYKNGDVVLINGSRHIIGRLASNEHVKPSSGYVGASADTTKLSDPDADSR